jgi:hypothetical protein
MNLGHLDTLAAALDAAGLGGVTPYRTASALLSLNGRSAAENAAIVVAYARRHGRDLLAIAVPEQAMVILAALVRGGMPLADILALLPAKERTV